MVVGQDVKGRRGVFRVDPESGRTSLVIAAAAGADGVFGGWTADGRSVVYTENSRRESLTSGKVVQRDLQTGADRGVFRFDGIEVFDPKVSPDKRWIAFFAYDSASAAERSLRIAPLSGAGWPLP